MQIKFEFHKRVSFYEDVTNEYYIFITIDASDLFGVRKRF